MAEASDMTRPTKEQLALALQKSLNAQAGPFAGHVTLRKNGCATICGDFDLTVVAEQLLERFWPEETEQAYGPGYRQRQSRADSREPDSNAPSQFTAGLAGTNNI